jgi:hypothetical protein
VAKDDDEKDTPRGQEKRDEDKDTPRGQEKRDEDKGRGRGRGGGRRRREGSDSDHDEVDEQPDPVVPATATDQPQPTGDTPQATGDLPPEEQPPEPPPTPAEATADSEPGTQPANEEQAEQAGDDEPDVEPLAEDVAPAGGDVRRAVEEARERAAYRDDHGQVGRREVDLEDMDEEQKNRAMLPSTDPAVHLAAMSGGTTLGARQVPAGWHDAGPGTQRTAPPELETAGTRPPARTVTDASAPIEAPDARLQTLPVRGYDESTSNLVASNVGMANTPGEDHVEIVDEDGAAVDPDDMFDDPSGGVATFVVAKRRLFEIFRYPGAAQVSIRQFQAPGGRVDRVTAERLKAARRLARNDEGQARTKVMGTG